MPAGRVVLVGEGAERAKIENIVKQHSLESRVKIAGHLDDAAIADLYARCRAVYYAPVNEDYGLVPIEAFRSRKPVLTATDSGGATELVQHGRNGYVLPASPEEFARHMTLLLEDSALAERLGSDGFESTKQINWPETVNRLLA